MTGYTYIKPSENLKDSHKEVTSILEKLGAEAHFESKFPMNPRTIWTLESKLFGKNDIDPQMIASVSADGYKKNMYVQVYANSFLGFGIVNPRLAFQLRKAGFRKA